MTERFFSFLLFLGQDVSCHNSHFPQGPQLTTPGVWRVSGQPITIFVDDCEELKTSYEWPEFDDFPSSEDLSAFLADLEKDDISKEAGQCLSTQHSKPSNSLRTSVSSDKITSHMMTSNMVTSRVKTLGEMTSDLMTSNIATLEEVVCRLSQTPIEEGCTELTDFPSEDLDAFLADMELHCENLPLGNSPVAVNTMRPEAFHTKRNYKAVEVRTFRSKELTVDNMGETDHTKFSKSISNFSDKEEAICDMDLGSDSFCASLSNKSNHNIDSSDYQFVRDCERVFIKLSKHACSDKDRTDNARMNHCSVLRHNNFGVNNQESVRQTKHFYASGRCSVEELHEEDNVCKMPLEHEEVNVVRSHDRDTNEIDDQQGSRSTGKECTLVDHQRNSEKVKSAFEMSNDEFFMISSSPDLFSQSLSRVEQNCSKTPDLFSSPGVSNGEPFSSCSRNLSKTPDLFSSPRSSRIHTHSVSRQEMNSISLFSSSDHSYLSSSSPFSSRVRQPSFPVSSENEADTPPITSNYEIGNQFDKNFQTACFHSTPCSADLPSKISRKMWTLSRVSPLLNDSRVPRPCNDHISIQGTPILFSPMSNSSL